MGDEKDMRMNSTLSEDSEANPLAGGRDNFDRLQTQPNDDDRNQYMMDTLSPTIPE